MRHHHDHSLPGGIAFAVGVGAVDGYGASRDASAGRPWTTPGVGLGGPVVVGWGWAPVVQVGAVLVGAVAHAQVGSAPLCAGLALLCRSSAFYASQQGHKPPVPTQG